MRVLVTGSRTWWDEERLKAELVEECDLLMKVYTSLYLAEGITIVTGACRQGADKMAERWTEHPEQFSVELETHPADWQHHRKRAGIIRNHEMVDLGANACLAFAMPCDLPSSKCNRPENHWSHGTTDCAMYARSKGIPTRWIYGEKR